MATRILLLLLVCIHAVAQITNVSIGSNPNDGAGDTLRTAFSKVNTNVAWLAGQLGSATNSPNFTTNATVAGADVATKVANVAALVALSPKQDGQLIQTLGYYSAGDGGGTEFYWSASSTASTNLGYTITPAAGGRFLAVPTDRINVRQFGAKGDGSTDDTASFQSAIDYSQGLTAKPPVIVPAGTYIIESIQTRNVSLLTEGGRIGNGPRTTATSGAFLVHKVGATNHMIVVAPTNVPVPRISGFTMRGNGEQNRKNPKTITAVSSRLSFTIAAADAPSAPATPAVWPFWGWAFLYSNEGQYLGGVLVEDVVTSGTNATVTVKGGYDIYATRNGASYLLEPGYQVCFSSSTTESATYASNTGIDSATAGYSAVHVTAQNGTAFISEIQLDNLKIERFHTGVRIGNVLFTYLSDCFITSCQYAAVATAFPGNTRDGMFKSLFTQGYYQSDQGKTYTNTLQNAPFQHSLYGLYGLDSTGQHDSMVIDHPVFGIYGQNIRETHVSSLLIDAPILRGIVLGGQNYGGAVQNLIVGSLIVRNENSSTYVPTSTTNKAYAVQMFGDYNQLSVGQMSVVGHGTAKYFDACFDITGTSPRAAIGDFGAWAGANNVMMSSGSTYNVRVLSSLIGSDGIRTYIGGTEKTLVQESLHTISNPLLVTSYVDAGNGATRLQANTVGMDSGTVSIRLGADSSTGTGRPDLTTKRMDLRLYNYTNANPSVLILYATASSSANSVWYGGVDGTLEVATSHNWMTGTKGALGGTQTMTLDNTVASATDTPIQLNVNGNFSRVYKSGSAGILYHGTVVPQLVPSVVTLSDGATITITCDAGKTIQNHSVTLGGARTLAISGATSGMSGVLRIIQDGTGGRTLALPAGSRVAEGGGGALSLTGTASSIDMVGWWYSGSAFFFWYLGKNFT